MASNRRKSRRKQLAASHQKNWLIGRYAVTETLEAGVWPVAELYVDEALDDDTIHRLAGLSDRQNLKQITVSKDRLSELCGSRHHQGIAARMDAFPYRSIADVLNPADNNAEDNRLIVICDRIQDSHNFGAILRCCDAMNVDSAIVSEHQQAVVSPQVARSSAGAVNHVAIVLHEDLVLAISQLQDAGFQIAAATEKADTVAWEEAITGPMALIIGNEAEGVAAGLLEGCDMRLRIPMQGQVGSLNAAVAAGILLYEIRRQQAR